MPKRPKKASPSRKKYLIVIIAILLLPLLLWQVGQQQIFRQNAAPGNRPNIIMIITDDQPKNTMKYLPYTERTLAKDGMTFTNAYVTTGLCCPSRASILTGQYAHNHKVFNNRPPNGGVKKFNDKETLPVWLKREGYTTALVGKYLNGYDSIAPYIPPGWSHWVAFDDDNGKYINYKLTINKKSKSFGKDEKDYSTDVLAEEAVQFIKKTKQPFFLYFAPHTPHGVPRPAYRHENNCDKTPPIDTKPNYNENDVSDKPQWIKKLPKLSKNEIKKQQEEFDRKMCTLKALDEAVKDMIQALGNKRNDTIIIFMSDNGYVFGEHRWKQKECFYEECVAVDMIISYPKITKGKMTTNQFALNIDLAPTILELAGIKIPPSVDGSSLVPLLRGEDKTIHESFLIETYNNESNPKGQDYGIRKGQYKYQELATGEKELYDLKQDPHELNNVANNPDYKNIRDQLAIELYIGKNSGNPDGNNPPSEPGSGEENIPTDTPAPERLPEGELISRKSSDLIPANDPDDLKCVTQNGNDGVITEVGCIPKDPLGFATEYYRIGLGLIGGLSLLFIIFGGYTLLTSEGNPQRIRTGKTYIFYAFIGLLLAIFGYVFMEVIAVDILHLPGFTRE